jgi:diadenosine tetraphosphate (Ap4A) HIT family hydrolase
VTGVLPATDAVVVTAESRATLPGYVCVTSRCHAVEPYELTAPDQVAFFLDCMAVARGAAAAMGSVKMNYEIHGNTIPHLHMHLFPRQPDDLYVGYVITSREWVDRSSADLKRLGEAITNTLAACGRLVPWP